jgi:hypothetical protein
MGFAKHLNWPCFDGEQVCTIETNQVEIRNVSLSNGIIKQKDFIIYFQKLHVIPQIKLHRIEKRPQKSTYFVYF